MKVIFFVLLCSVALTVPVRAQRDAKKSVALSDSISSGPSLEKPALGKEPALEKEPPVSLPGVPPAGEFNSTLNSIGSLFNDDRQYYTRQPLWLPLLKITLSNTGLWLADRYIFNYDFSHIGFNSWSENLKRGFTWRDTDRFGNDFFFHPYSGGGYFMDARSLGYSFWECLPFTVFGSAEWKYFFETDQPSYPDLINSSVNGLFMGEVGYRITSNVLNDEATGFDRAWREVVVGLISPSRFFSRLITGKLWDVSTTPTLEQEPMDVAFSLGPHVVNNGTKFGSGPVKFSANLALEYGDPYEDRVRKPFDHFKLWGEFTNAYQRKYLGEVTGYGLLAGSNLTEGNLLFGLFQHFDYFDNLTFELGDLSFGPGLIAKVPFDDHSGLFTAVHASFIPFGANNAGFFPNPTADQRDYSYGDGAEGMTETGISFGDHAVELAAIGYYIYFHSYYGQAVTNSMLLLKPRLVINVVKNVGIGLEDQIYLSDRLSPSLESPTLERSEQRLFVQWRWDDFKKE